MMRWAVNSAEVDPGTLTDEQRFWVYNGLDCGVTYEVFERLRRRLDEVSSKSYDLTQRLQQTALAMTLRGFKIDRAAVAKVARELDTTRARLRIAIDETAQPIWGKPLNPNAAGQVQSLLYEHMGLPIQLHPKTKRPTVGKGALALLREQAPDLIDLLLEFGGLKDINRLCKAAIDADGRMRCGFTAVGTETGRWASRRGPFWGGTNLQNIPKVLRHIFVADPGYVLVAGDLKNADSFNIAYLSGDDDYIKLQHSKDPHKAVAAWIFGVEFDDVTPVQRQRGKAGQHALNYYPGGVWSCIGMLKARLGFSDEGAEHFVRTSFAKFPGVRRYHDQVKLELMRTGVLTTPFGRRRRFFENPYEARTLREAVAHMGQSMTADCVNTAILRLAEIDQGMRSLAGLRTSEFQLLAQVHDEIVAQVPEGRDDLILALRDAMLVDTPVNGRTLKIPVEIKVGSNWRDMRVWPDGESH